MAPPGHHSGDHHHPVGPGRLIAAGRLDHPKLKAIDFGNRFLIDTAIQIQEQEEWSMGILPALTETYQDKRRDPFPQGEDLEGG